MLVSMANGLEVNPWGLPLLPFASPRVPAHPGENMEVATGEG